MFLDESEGPTEMIPQPQIEKPKPIWSNLNAQDPSSKINRKEIIEKYLGNDEPPKPKAAAAVNK